MTEKKPPPRLPGGPDPTAPVPREPVLGKSLDDCAQIAALVAESPKDRRAVLARNGLDDARWTEIETTWMLRVATALLQGDTAPKEAYDAAFQATRDGLGGDGPSRPLADYARLQGQLEAGLDSSSVLTRAGLSLADWSRLVRAWSSRLAQDAALAETFRAMVSEAKASALRERRGEPE